MENQQKYKRIVIKIGTSTITGHTNRVNQPALIDLIRQISVLVSQGISVVLVSSGAVAAGREALNYPHFPKHIPGKQMLAAIGQPRLMAIYNKIFRMYGQNTAQILLTRNAFVHRASYLNIRNTLEGLLNQGIIPIINENDTVSINELKVGDNDSLSAMVSGLVGADLLILATDQDGLFTGDPSEDPNAKLIECIDTPEIPEFVWMAAGGSVSGLGTGGMSTKVSAADIARRMGTDVIVANGSTPDILIKIASGEVHGTVFRAVTTLIESRKRFILSEYKPNGGYSVKLDAGAKKAVLNGKSLLPAGMCAVTGSFERGDAVQLTDMEGNCIGYGITNYSSEDASKLCGVQADEIAAVLGYTFGNEIIHRDFMVANVQEEK